MFRRWAPHFVCIWIMVGKAFVSIYIHRQLQHSTYYTYLLYKYTSLKGRCYHVHDIVIIGCTATCHIATDANFVIMTSLQFHNTVITIYTNTDHINLPEYESNHIDHFVFIGCTGGCLTNHNTPKRRWLQWCQHNCFFDFLSVWA